MNIYDIARLANVSIATVSRVVNDSERVSEKTKQKVRAVMKEQGYTPNIFARGLGLDSMKTIGIICPDISDAYMSLAVSQLESQMHEYGYDCILYCSGFEQKSKEQSVQLLIAKRIDALILVGSTYAGRGNRSKDIEYIKQAAKQVPVFLINGMIEAQGVSCALCNDFQATFDITSQMIESGRERILFLCDSHSYSAIQKVRGYESALKEYGYPILGDLKLYIKNKIHYTRDLLLERKDLVFDGILATEDGMAVGAVKYAKAKQLHIPTQLCIVGYNNSHLAISSEPEITSLDSRVEELCHITIERVMEVLGGGTLSSPISQVEGQLVKRCTTDF